MEQVNSPASKTNTNNQQQTVGHNSRRADFKNMNDMNRSFRSISRSVSGASRGPGILPGSSSNIQTSNIVNRALEVMSKSLKETDYTPRKPIKSLDDVDTESESETAHSPSDSGNSDNEIDAPPSPEEPKSRLGNMKAQLSFRKIAKKRRKAGGQTSFHHTKSSKEYLRKAQEAYQRLKISEQQEEKKESKPQSQVESNKDKEESEQIDYGYGDSAPDKKTNDEVDYGYGDAAESQPDQTVDYGYGDAPGGQPQTWRREKPKRRNSVTKYSMQAANVVAAQAAAARILKLNPNFTSLNRSTSTPTKSQSLEQTQPLSRRRQVSEGRRVATMQTTVPTQHPQQRLEEAQKRMPLDRFAPPQRPGRRQSNDRGLQSPRLQVTSDYFSSDAKPKNLVHRNPSRTFRFTAPARTSSCLSNDTYSMNKTDDDDDCDSLASDMESLCSIRDASYRSDSLNKTIDMPPVLPSPDRRSRFTGGGRNISGEFLRRPLIVQWSNGSNKDGVMSRFASKSRRERSGSNDYSILPSVRVGGTNGSKSKSCMPAPVRRTPSYKGPQRQD